MKTFWCAAFAAFVASTAFAGHPFRVEDMQQVQRIGSPRMSPDGKWVAFPVSRSDVAKNRMVTNLWIVPAGGGTPRQLTFGDAGANADPRWSPDSRSLYFVSTRSGNKPQVFRMPVDGGEARQITNLPVGVSAYAISPDGKTLALTAAVFPRCSDMACNENEAKERDDNPVKVRVITDVPFRRWDSWVDGKRNHILVMSADGGEVKDLTPGDVDSPVWSEDGGDEVSFSPDGRELAFSRYTDNESLTGNSDLFVVPVGGGAPAQITTSKGSEWGPKYSPDARYLAYAATLRPGQEADLVRLFLYDRTTRQSKNIFEAVDRSVGSYEWSADGRSLFVTFEDRGQTAVARLDVATLALTPLVTAGTSSGIDVAADGGSLVFSTMTFSQPAELYRLELAVARATQPTALTRMNETLLRDIDFGEFSSFTYAGWNGDQVQAWQLKPPGFDPSKKYPLLLLMHGGPQNQWANMFHFRWNAQLFAAAGYVVIMPNFHGSSGFGLGFMDAIQGQWGGAPYEDHMKAVDVALTWPYIDTTRIAAAGASYGGYMANWLEGHTDRFRTIVSHDGLFDLTLSLYAMDFVAPRPQQFGGALWEKPQPLLDNAPMTFAKNFRTPMLVIHGERDYRVEIGQGLAMFQTLQAMHVPSKLLLFTEENHWVLKPADSIFWYHSVLEWLDEWVKPDASDYRRRLQPTRTTN
jgi:dipeptidyl aminopeptidase/acylaminoacyl peptidase